MKNIKLYFTLDNLFTLNSFQNGGIERIKCLSIGINIVLLSNRFDIK